jgi:hypothetical protein
MEGISKLKIELPYNSSIPLLQIYLKGHKAMTQAPALSYVLQYYSL